MNYEALKEKAMAVHYRVQASKNTLEELTETVKLKEQEFKNIKTRSVQLIEALDAMKIIMDEYSRKNMREIEQLLNLALSLVFYDRNFSVRIDTSDKRDNKYAELLLLENVNGQVVEVSFRDDTATGGGVMAVVGFVIQVYYILYFKLNHIIFCDEAFSQISTEYVEGLMAFMDQLAQREDFNIVLVSHDVRWIEKANRTYLVEAGKISEITQKEIG